MRWISNAAVAVLTTGLFTPAFLQASPFDFQRVPAAAKWVFHLDMDAARGTRTWEMLSKRLESNPSYHESLSKVETLTGMHFPQDLRDVTLFGASSGEEAVALIHGTIDKAKTLAALQENPAYGSQAFGEYQVLTWDDKGKTMFGAFHDDSNVIIGRSEETVEGALKTMDHKAPATGAVLAAGAKSQPMVYFSGKDLIDMKKVGPLQSPMLAEMENAWISISEKADSAVVHANIVSRTPEATEQISTALEGIRAMVNLAANAENAAPNAKNAAIALDSLKATVEDRTMQIDWPVSIDLIGKLLERGASRQPIPVAPKSAPSDQ